MRLLIVEDETRLADTLRQLLHRQGYTADVCYDGVSGLDNALTGIYDLMVLDVMLPGLNGFQVARQLRDAGIATPVLMLTAKSDLSDRVHGLDCGADYYLTKPFEPEELLACVRTLLRRPVAGARHVYPQLQRSGCAAQPPGVRPDGASDAQRRPGGHQGAAAHQGLGL